MEAQQAVKNLAASLVNDKRYNDLRVALYDLVPKRVHGSAGEAYGAFMGLLKSFEQLEVWAAEGKSIKLKELEVSLTDKPEPEPEGYDPDMERTS